jgi:hypothetical protein
VRAVVVGAPAPGTLEAVRRQADVRVAADLAGALARAGGDRLWLVDARAEPAPDALERLLAADVAAPLVASLPVDADGRIVAAALPRGDEAGTPLLVRAVPRGLVPIRRAPLTSLLVARRDVPAPDPRFGPLAALAWTGRVMADEPGYVVLASRVRVPPPPAPGPAVLPAVARLRRAGLLTRGEAARMAARALTPRRR